MALPPSGLVLAMLTMVTVASAIGISLAVWLRGRSLRVATVGAVLAVALLGLHAVWLNGNPLIVRWVRSADAIVWANFSPLFAAVLIACAWRTMAVRWQRWVMLGAVASICLMQAYAPIFGRMPAMQPSRVADGVHRQSTLSTCSAAAAATLLGTMGINTTETEMAALCLTRTGGTFQLGLYRGLRLKTPNATVEFLNGDVDAVVTSPQPVIASLGMVADGWNPLQRRVGHSVVILGRNTDGRLNIADPMTGSRYPMTVDAFRNAWAGEAMRIVQRVDR